MRLKRLCAIAAILSVATGNADSQTVTAAATPPRQTEGDAYTRYELLAPGSGKFRIVYEVTATTAGATFYFNPIRAGSIATDESVFDRATGKPLPFDVVGSTEARAGGVRSSDSLQQYIRVSLPRPVPANGGEARVLIDKTYQDAKSYFVDGDAIVFNRPLGIKRNAIVLPVGYEVVSSNYPSQIIQEDDGRLSLSFWNATPAEAPVVIRARRVQVGTGRPRRDTTLNAAFQERAHEHRKIVYTLQQPETHRFDVVYDFTESRVGTSRYVTELDASAMSQPSGRNLDTGDTLSWSRVSDPRAGRVVYTFPAITSGGSTRIRISETYTDAARYTVVGNALVWRGRFVRPSNAVVLPAGWTLTNSSMPVAVTELPDGRTRLDFINPRGDAMVGIITAQRER